VGRGAFYLCPVCRVEGFVVGKLIRARYDDGIFFPSHNVELGQNDKNRGVGAVLYGDILKILKKKLE
jgi:hypothetical protein